MLVRVVSTKYTPFSLVNGVTSPVCEFWTIPPPRPNTTRWPASHVSPTLCNGRVTAASCHFCSVTTPLFQTTANGCSPSLAISSPLADTYFWPFLLRGPATTWYPGAMSLDATDSIAPESGTARMRVQPLYSLLQPFTWHNGFRRSSA